MVHIAYLSKSGKDARIDFSGGRDAQLALGTLTAQLGHRIGRLNVMRSPAHSTLKVDFQVRNSQIVEQNARAISVALVGVHFNNCSANRQALSHDSFYGCDGARETAAPAGNGIMGSRVI